MLRLAFPAALLLFAIAAPHSVVAGADVGPHRVSASDCMTASVATPGDLRLSESAPTPAAAPLAGVDEIEERDFPLGDVAGPATVDALFALERQYAACLNVGDYRALAPLFDAALREEVMAAFPQLEEPAATPDVPADPSQIEKVALRCVRTYPGGFAAALLDWTVNGVVETNARVYRDAGAGWLILDEVTAYGRQGEGCDTG